MERHGPACAGESGACRDTARTKGQDAGPGVAQGHGHARPDRRLGEVDGRNVLRLQASDGVLRLAVQRGGERLRENQNGKPLAFHGNMNVRDQVEIAPRLNVFEEAELAGLCHEVRDRIARVDPDVLRPSRWYGPRLANG